MIAALHMEHEDELDDTVGLVFDDRTFGDERTTVLDYLREMRLMYANAPGARLLDEAIGAIERGDHHARGTTAATKPVPRVTMAMLLNDEEIVT